MEFPIVNIICVALPMKAKTEKTTFLCKDEQYKALYIHIGVGARDLYIDEAHRALDIFCFAAFF